MIDYINFRFRSKPLPSGSFAEFHEWYLRQIYLEYAATGGEKVWSPPPYNSQEAVCYIRNYLKRNKKP